MTDQKTKNLKHLTKNNGFTLIEILVSATIIGILSTIGFSGFQAITRSGRDALRKSDLESIRSALEVYKSENKSYPDAIGCTANLTTDYLNPYPTDVKSPTYNYCYIQDDALSYRLCAHLENTTTTTEYCGTNKCTAACNYQVINP